MSDQLEICIKRFVDWLKEYGEDSWDHQSFYAGPWGRRAKALYYQSWLLGIPAVSLMVFCEAFLPSARRLFHWPIRFPIADAHYAMGFAFLAEALDDERFYRRAVSFLDALIQSRCTDFHEYCWGYPLDWVTRNGTIPAQTPLITSTPYAYEAFLQIYRLDGKEAWEGVLRSIARHALTDICDFQTTSKAACCSYTPWDKGGVVNASAYRAFLLASAHLELGIDEAEERAEGNLNFVLESQQPDGSWFYAMDGERSFVDHFHTCFVLKALSKIHALRAGHSLCRAIEKGVDYYLSHLIDERGLPRPFAKAPRLTVYRRELYDYAECVNLCVLLRERIPALGRLMEGVLHDLFERWLKPDGSFRSRKLIFGWDNVPMHRWAQSQLFRSLSFLLREERCQKRSDSEEIDVRNLRPV